MPVFSKLGLKPVLVNHVLIDGVADGYEAFVLAKILEEAGDKGLSCSLPATGSAWPILSR